MKLCTAVQEGCGYKDTLLAHRYFAPSAKYFTVCITYQPPLVYLETSLHVSGGISTHHQERTQLYLQYLVLVKPLLLPAAIVEEMGVLKVNETFLKYTYQ